MADFARVLAAVDQLQGTKGLARFTEQARTMAQDSVSADPLLARMEEMKLDFEGKAAELLVKVTPDEDRWRPPRDWPKGARAVTGLLKRHAPALRKAGWVVEMSEDKVNHFFIWTVVHPEKVGNPSPSSPSSPLPTDQTDHTENGYGQSRLDPQPVPAPPAHPQCRVCAAGLWHPESQQRGVCQKCYLQAAGKAS